jgi:hypothetical protein
MFQTLLHVIGFSPSYNFIMWMWTESKLKCTNQAWHEGIIGRNPSSFEPLIKPVKSSWNITCNRILYLHTTYSNWHILILGNQNHVIQNLKLIYTSRTTTFMKDSRSDKIILKAKIQTQSEGQDWSSDLKRKLTVSSIPLWLRVWHRNDKTYDLINM